ncbi:hypothetical protein B7494_g1928 [Chlorociboria aeruginascens]|nr:hypothetical protein B7494_g1928 [Chlorociboria aeruginascens]
MAVSRRAARIAQLGIASVTPAIQIPEPHYAPPETLRSPTIHPKTRREDIKNAKSFSSFLTDTFQRQHDYLRISITEKCNLRCLYCMPEEGVPQSPPPDLLTTPEIYLLSSIFVSQGVRKIRLTGGEPTVRRDILPLMHQIGSLRSQGLRELCLTTNGISLHRKLDSMVEAGLTGVNLSLDTLDPWQFQIMTRRKGFEAVMKSIERILEMNKLGAGIKLKINCVVMRDMNDQEILPFVELGREKDIEVRFIEYMPFDGNKWSQGKMMSYQEMLGIIREKYPMLRKVQNHKNDTSKTYEVPGFIGKIGFITSMTHNFCGTCNRLRITSDGNLKVCLFGNAEVSLRDILRKSNAGQPIDEQTLQVMRKMEMDRRQEMGISQQALSSPNEQELLEVIGMAVNRKKEKHADSSSWIKRTEMRKIISGPSTIRRKGIPIHLLSTTARPSATIRKYSTRPPIPELSSQSPSQTEVKNSSPKPSLTHLTPSGSAHMVSISDKAPTKRTAVAVCSISFSNPTALPLICENRAMKGDVLGVARIAGIMAAKRTPDLIPLCHPIAITYVGVELEACTSDVSSLDNASLLRPSDQELSQRNFGRVDICATLARVKQVLYRGSVENRHIAWQENPKLTQLMARATHYMHSSHAMRVRPLFGVPFEERGLLVDGRNEKNWANLRDHSCVPPDVRTRFRNASISSQSSSRTISSPPSTYAASDYSTELYFPRLYSPSIDYNHTRSLAPMVDSGSIQQSTLQVTNPLGSDSLRGYETPQYPSDFDYTSILAPPASVYHPHPGTQHSYSKKEQTLGAPQILLTLAPAVAITGRKIIVTSLPHSATLSDISELVCSATQKAHKLEMPLGSNGKSRGHVFVTFHTHQDAQIVVDTLNNLLFQGRILTVRLTREAEFSRGQKLPPSTPRLGISSQHYLPSPTTSSSTERSKSVRPPEESFDERYKREDGICEVLHLRKFNSTPMVADGSNMGKHLKSSDRIH